MDKNIEIEIPSGENNSKFSSLKNWVGTIAVAVSFVMSIHASTRSDGHDSSEAVYKETIIHIQRLHKDIQDTRDDQTKIRAYLDHYIRSSSVIGPSSNGFVQPTNLNAPVVLIPIDKSKIRNFPGPDTQPVLVLPAVAPPPLPESNGPVEKMKIRDYKEITGDSPSQIETVK